MKAVIQRVSQASVAIAGSKMAEIKQGFVVLLGVQKGDTKEAADYLVRKIANLRVFEDESGKMNQSLADIKGEVLSISQFTLLANTKKGNRPSFIDAELPEVANELYVHFNCELKALSIPVKTGVFGANMAISLINDGPVTIIFDTNQK